MTTEKLVDDRSSGEELPSDIQGLDESFRCEICADLLSNAVTIKECGHSYCSECIRRHFHAGLTGLKREACCPKCRYVLKTDANRALVPNHTLQHIVQQYRTLRPTLIFAERKTAVTEVSTAVSTTGRSTKRSPSRKDSTGQCELDGADKESKALEIPRTALKIRPTTSYTGMKKQRLQDLCRREGLLTAGSHGELLARHQLFVQLWNHEADNTIAPKSKAEIVELVKSRENSKQLVAEQDRKNGVVQQSKLLQNIKETRARSGKGEDIPVTSGDPQFDATLEKGFAKLIEKGGRKSSIASQKKTSKQPISSATATAIAPKRSPRQSKATTKTETSKGSPKKTANEKVDSASIAASSDAAASSDSSTVDPQKPEQKKLPSSSPSSTVTTVASSTTTKKAPIKSKEGKQPKAAAGDEKKPVKKTATKKAAPKAKPPARAKRKTAAATTAEAKTEEKARPKRGTKRSAPEPTKTAEEEPVRKGRAKRAAAGPWDCKVCTFRNSVRTWKHARCEICNAERK